MRGYGLWADTRIGNNARWVYCDEADLMEIPDEIRGCIGFVAAGRSEYESSLTGTAFFVGVPNRVPGALWHTYAITAKHVLEPGDDNKGKPKPPYKAIGLRCNRLNDSPDVLWTDKDRWEKHPTADVAAYYLNTHPDPDIWDFRVYPMNSVAGPAFRIEHRVKTGNDIYVPGLFTHHPGTSALVPVVRVGTIAALDDDGDDIPSFPYSEGKGVFLAQTLSIGGVSGSPVFWVQPHTRLGPDGKVQTVNLGKGATEIDCHWLLGVVSTVFDQPGGTVRDRDEERLNTGITMVEPVERILEVLDQKRLWESRKDMEDKQRNSKSPRAVRATPASTEVAPDNDGVTREEFMRDLTKVTQREEQPEQEG